MLQQTKSWLKRTLVVMVIVAAWLNILPEFNPFKYNSFPGKAALAWAENLTLIATQGAPDSLYDTVATQFSAKEITGLTIAIGLMNAHNRLAISSCKLPDSAPRA